MFQISTNAAAKGVVSTSTLLNVTLPAAVVKAYARATKINTAAQSIGAAEGALAGAVVRALDNDTDPAADSEVQRLLAAAQIGNAGIRSGAEQIVAEDLRAAFTANADTIVRLWAKPFDVAAADLAESHRILNGLDLNDAAAVVRRGAAATDAWTTAQKALELITAAESGWSQLATLTNLTTPSDQTFRVCRLAEVDYSAWVEHELARRKMTAYEMLSLGLRLSLPTTAEYRRRVAAIKSAAEAEADADHAAATGRLRREATLLA